MLEYARGDRQRLTLRQWLRRHRWGLLVGLLVLSLPIVIWRGTGVEAFTWDDYNTCTASRFVHLWIAGFRLPPMKFSRPFIYADILEPTDPDHPLPGKSLAAFQARREESHWVPFQKPPPRAGYAVRIFSRYDVAVEALTASSKSTTRKTRTEILREILTTFPSSMDGFGNGQSASSRETLIKSTVSQLVKERERSLPPPGKTGENTLDK